MQDEEKRVPESWLKCAIAQEEGRDKMNKLLFVGDFATVGNWGAQGTSTMLKSMVQRRYDGWEVATITYGSFVTDTPRDGWPAPPQARKRTVTARLYTRAKRLLKRVKSHVPQTSPARPDSVPATAAEFESAARKMLDEEILPYEGRLLKECDLVFINGEGSLVHSSRNAKKYRRSGRYNLFLAYVTKKHLQKPCYIVNHTVDPDHPDAEEMIRLVYPMLDHVAVREPCSARELKRIGFAGQCAVVPDALFTFQPNPGWTPSEVLKKEIDFERSYICLGDSSATPDVHWDIAATYQELIIRLMSVCEQVILVDGNSAATHTFSGLAKKMGIGHVTVRKCSYADLYQVFKRSLIYLSGRWHPSILSAMAGTPVLLWSADSHKTKGFLEMFEYPSCLFPIQQLPEMSDEIIAETQRLLDMRDSLHEMLIRKSQQFAKDALQNVEF